MTIDNCENAALIGVTVQNGLAYGLSNSGYGGGIEIWEVPNLMISNCCIRNNKSIMGGGIFSNQSNVILKGNRILNNWGLEKAGGILIGNNTNMQFNDFDLNSIFLNYSSSGSDIYLSEYLTVITNIIVDTFTVCEPDFFFITPSELYNFTANNHKIDQINQDLYIAPDGDDNNSGLTAEDPLKTIAWAQTLIERNDEHPNTIHLAAGIYSPSLNNQIYPLNIKHGIIYSGESPYATILDAEQNSSIFHFDNNEDIYTILNINNIKLINGKRFNNTLGGAIFIRYQAEIYLSNVVIEDCYGITASSIQSNDGFYKFDNLIVKNNSGGKAISLIANYQNQNPVLDVEIKNSLIQNNFPGTEEGNGGGLGLHGHISIPGDFYAMLINCEISNNHDNFYNTQTGLGGSVCLNIGTNLIVNLVNCTLGDNTLSHNTGCAITVNNTVLNLYNTILFNNDGYSFNLFEDAVVNISNSLIEGGDDNINYYYPLAIVNWLEGNIDEDPHWLGEESDYPFALDEDSPCIDAGTLDLPAGIELPEYDLAGNPRIYGDMVDMGAYEYQDVGSDEEGIPAVDKTRLSNYPNPFTPGEAGRSSATTIKLELAESGKVDLAVYSIKGQKVKTLLNADTVQGIFEIGWNGTDESNKKVPSGQYILKLTHNGKMTAAKIMLLR
ncbi:MAG: T9SS type A sorting domain-containing protein [Candidatus Cloacimonetes bacterium]|nr:T9SS type A sorting domain-containing protein [Candidatus Cloacimonadota bacterium]